MTVQELISRLEDVIDLVGEDAEVLWAAQPNWPFEYSIRDVVPVTENMRDELELMQLRDEGVPPEDIELVRAQRGVDQKPGCIYLVEGRQLGYLDPTAREEIGW